MKVVVGISGGVDSAVSLLILKKMGFKVVPVFLNFGFNRKDMVNAKRICRILNLKSLVVDCGGYFKKKIVDYFAFEYLKGRTPNPCVVCNYEVKFKIFLDLARREGAEWVATGHYARIVWKDGEPYLTSARDKTKSQEYYLSFLPSSLLKKILFPLGIYTKSEVIEIARKEGLLGLCREESQDVCFIKGSDYYSFLKDKYGFEAEQGFVVNRKGEVIGYHEGFLKYTVGQRKGLKTYINRRFYVLKILPEKNIIVAGERGDAYFRRVRVRLVRWRGVGSGRYRVRVRYSHSPSWASVEVRDGNAIVCFDIPQFAPAPGQVACFYDSENLVVGAGFVEEVLDF